MSGSLSQATNFVAAGAFSLGAVTVFQPENTELGEYTFLPWVRTGLAAQLADPAAGAVRATVTVAVNVQDDAGGSSQVSKTLTLRGPGDVLGIDSTQIVRRYPQPNSFNAEETYLAHIEFDRPELPWLFTPYQPKGDRLAPWIALIAVEERLSNIAPGPPGLPPQLTTQAGELQPLDDSWAWAHAQICGKPAGAVTVEDRLTDDYGPTNLSRLLCPRKLDPDTSYIACVVPAFDCGARAAMGLNGGTLGPAWTSASGDITLPVYDYWRFHITSAGDFESLAKKLTGIPAPWQIGRRIIDFSKPRGGMAQLGPSEAGRVQVLKCALTSPAPAPDLESSELESSAWTTARRQELMARVNQGDEAAGDASKASDLPRVSPRLYARYQRAQSRLTAVNDADWFPQLNTTPTHRIVAGLGTRVVQKDQEPLMQAAWAQVGEIDKVNRQIALAQFARYAAESLHKNHFSRLSLGDLGQITRVVQGKLVLNGTALTVAGTVFRSTTAPAALTGAFRRSTRLRGPLTRFLGSKGAAALRSFVASKDRFQDFRRPQTEPNGIGGLSASAIGFYSEATIGKVLNVQNASARTALGDAVAKNAAKPTVADRLLSPQASWQVPNGSIDLGSMGASRLLDLVEAAAPATPAEAPSRAEALSGILTGLSTSGIQEAATRAGAIAGRIGIRLPATLSRVPAPHLARAARLAPVTVGPLAGVAARVPPAAETPIGTAVDTRVSRNISVKVNTARTVSYQQAARSFSEVATGTGTSHLPAAPGLSPLSVAGSQLLDAIQPRNTVTAYMVARLGKLPAWLAKDWFDDGFVQPIMQAPVFTRPMYEALDSYDRQWLVPGLGSIKEPDLVTILQTNPAFIEAFLVGLSDEMGRELLWRGYPTDCRATYFKRFWNAETDELGQQIHLFSHTQLATHISSAAGGAAGRLVLVVRGELIRRYPHAVMLAQQQAGTDPDGHPLFANPPAHGNGSILFHVPLAPDIFLTGFMLTEEDLSTADRAGHPWWFLIAEHPTAPRFGLDLPVDSAQFSKQQSGITITRGQGTWEDFGPRRLKRFLNTGGQLVQVKEPAPSAEATAWSANKLHGGAVARVLLRDPFRAAWNGLKLISPAKP